jgi:ureidoacrylate peracid hydrolase
MNSQEQNTMDRRVFLRSSLATAAIGGITLRCDAAFADGERAQKDSAGLHVPHAASNVVTLAAKPTEFKFDTAKAAMIVVDMQNDFGSKGGMFDRAGRDISMIQRAVGPTSRALAACRASGIKVIYLKMGFRPDLSDMGSEDAPNRVRHLAVGVGKTIQAPNGTASRILIRDTWNTEIIPALTPQASDIVLYKHRFSGFYQTDLDAILKRLGAKSLIVTGCTTSICVESTIRDAMFRDYSCALLADCTGEPIGHDLTRSNHEASLLTIQTLFGWVSNSDEFIGALPKADAPRLAKAAFRISKG